MKSYKWVLAAIIAAGALSGCSQKNANWEPSGNDLPAVGTDPEIDPPPPPPTPLPVEAVKISIDQVHNVVDFVPPMGAKLLPPNKTLIQGQGSVQGSDSGVHTGLFDTWTFDAACGDQARKAIAEHRKLLIYGKGRVSIPFQPQAENSFAAPRFAVELEEVDSCDLGDSQPTNLAFKGHFNKVELTSLSLEAGAPERAPFISGQGTAIPLDTKPAVSIATLRVNVADAGALVCVRMAEQARKLGEQFEITGQGRLVQSDLTLDSVNSCRALPAQPVEPSEFTAYFESVSNTSFSWEVLPINAGASSDGRPVILPPPPNPEIFHASGRGAVIASNSRQALRLGSLNLNFELHLSPVCAKMAEQARMEQRTLQVQGAGHLEISQNDVSKIHYNLSLNRVASCSLGERPVRQTSLLIKQVTSVEDLPGFQLDRPVSSNDAIGRPYPIIPRVRVTGFGGGFENSSIGQSGAANDGSQGRPYPIEPHFEAEFNLLGDPVSNACRDIAIRALKSGRSLRLGGEYRKLESTTTRVEFTKLLKCELN